MDTNTVCAEVQVEAVATPKVMSTQDFYDLYNDEMHRIVGEYKLTKSLEACKKAINEFEILIPKVKIGDLIRAAQSQIKWFNRRIKVLQNEVYAGVSPEFKAQAVKEMEQYVEIMKITHTKVKREYSKLNKHIGKWGLKENPHYGEKVNGEILKECIENYKKIIFVYYKYVNVENTARVIAGLEQNIKTITSIIKNHCNSTQNTTQETQNTKENTGDDVEDIEEDIED